MDFIFFEEVTAFDMTGRGGAGQLFPARVHDGIGPIRYRKFGDRYLTYLLFPRTYEYTKPDFSLPRLAPGVIESFFKSAPDLLAPIPFTNAGEPSKFTFNTKHDDEWIGPLNPKYGS